MKNMAKNFLKISLAIILFSFTCYAQVTTVNATITDPSGQAWAIGNFAVDWQRPASNQGTAPNINGVPIIEHGLGGNLDAVAHFTINLADSALVVPSGGQWVFTICPFASSQCYVIPSDTQVTGGGVDLSVFLNSAINNPAVNTMNIPRAYKDSEIINPPKGGFYYDITLNCLKFYNGIVFACVGTGGGGGGGVTPGLTKQQAVYTSPTSIGGQNKPIYDTRDWMTCDGVTDATSGMNDLLTAIGTTTATISFPSPLPCILGTLLFPPNVTLDFTAGGSVSGIVNTTLPGGAAFVSGNSIALNSPTVINSCSVTLTTTGTPASPTFIVFMGEPYPGFTFHFNNPTDTAHHVYVPMQVTLAGQARNEAAWVAAGVTTSTAITITATSTGTLTHAQCMAQEYSGLGPGVATDGTLSDARGTLTPMNSGSATVTAGSLLIGYGGQPFTLPQICTAGAGYTQPAGTAGQTPDGALCAEYQLAAAGGSISATQNFNTPLGGGETWVYALLALKPGSSNLFIQGGLIDPDLHQIFVNLTGAPIGGFPSGTVDFTNNASDFVIHPEWWGASGTASQTINTPALQAAEHAAFGTNRTSASGLTKWNKPLYLMGPYTINDELKFYNVINFKIICDGRLQGGIIQNGLNKRIIDGQSVAYGTFDQCTWTNSNTSTTSQIDLDYDGVITAGSLRPQFIDFKENNFIGNGVAAVGVQIAKSGGGAQGSNIYCYDCAAQSFTTAAWRIGTPTALATNALAFGWYGGDIQGSPQYGIAVYGGGYFTVYGTTFENGFSTQTGFDIFQDTGQGPCIVEGVRSESRRMVSCTLLDVKDSGTGTGQMQYPTPGTSAPVGTVLGGDPTGIGWDGRYYKVSIDTHGFNGVGTPSVFILASSGTGTSITDTNQNVTGSQTIGTFAPVPIETVTQAVTGSTGTIRNTPLSTATVTGTNGATPITLGETFTQSVTGITAIQVAPTPGFSTSSPLFLQHLSGTADNTHTWVGGTSGAVYTPNAAPTFSSTTMLISAATGVPDNTHAWTGGTTGAVFVPTTVPTDVVNWGVNAFTGMLVSIMGGTSMGCYGVITSNTSQSVTFTGGLLTHFSGLDCPTPDLNTQFIVQPNWNNLTIVDDNVPGCAPCMTLVPLNENAIGGGSGVASGILNNVSAPGGTIKINSINTTIKNLLVTRPDWYDASAGNPQQNQNNHDWTVSLTPRLAKAGISYFRNWSLPFSGGGQRSFVGPFHTDLGTGVLAWSCSIPGGGLGCNDTWIGGRSDPNAQADATRTVLEYGGMLGRAARFGTNLVGTDTDITGGPSTGSGVGGAVNFYTSNPGASSALVNSGLKRWSITGAGNLTATGAMNVTTTGTVTAASITTTGSPGIATGTASNTDLAGELAFAGATTSATYTFAGTYVSHPECTITPLFSPTAGHVIWISTLSTTSLQFSSDIAQTGAVSYICIGRN